MRFEECRNVVIHETADPEVIVVEYELAGTASDRSSTGAYAGQARITANAPAIMKGPKGMCCFLVARPDISSAAP